MMILSFVAMKWNWFSVNLGSPDYFATGHMGINDSALF